MNETRTSTRTPRIRRDARRRIEEFANRPDDVGPDDERCTAGKPLLMLIPEGGTTIGCPVHPEGHFVVGPPKMRC